MRLFGRVTLVVLALVALAPGLSMAQAAPPIAANHIRVHYHRPDGAYAGWTVYAFGDTTEDQGNFGGGPVQIARTDSFGAFFDVGVTAASSSTTGIRRILGRMSL